MDRVGGGRPQGHVREVVQDAVLRAAAARGGAGHAGSSPLAGRRGSAGRRPLARLVGDWVRDAGYADEEDVEACDEKHLWRESVRFPERVPRAEVAEGSAAVIKGRTEKMTDTMKRRSFTGQTAGKTPERKQLRREARGRRRETLCSSAEGQGRACSSSPAPRNKGAEGHGEAEHAREDVEEREPEGVAPRWVVRDGILPLDVAEPAPEHRPLPVNPPAPLADVVPCATAPRTPVWGCGHAGSLEGCPRIAPRHPSGVAALRLRAL